MGFNLQVRWVTWGQPVGWIRPCVASAGPCMPRLGSCASPMCWDQVPCSGTGPWHPMPPLPGYGWGQVGVACTTPAHPHMLESSSGVPCSICPAPHVGIGPCDVLIAGPSYPGSRRIATASLLPNLQTHGKPQGLNDIALGSKSAHGPGVGHLWDRRLKHSWMKAPLPLLGFSLSEEPGNSYQMWAENPLRLLWSVYTDIPSCLDTHRWGASGQSRAQQASSTDMAIDAPG